MKSGTVLNVAAACAAALLCHVGLAQYTPNDQNPAANQNQNQNPRYQDRDRSMPRSADRMNDQNANAMMLERASKLIGRNVEDSNGRDIGEIQNLAIDSRQGTVRYVILSYDDKYIPVPWDMFQLQGTTGTRHAIRANLTREDLRNAPTINRHQYSMLADEQFAQQVNQYFGSGSMNMNRQNQPNMQQSGQDRSMRNQDSRNQNQNQSGSQRDQGFMRDQTGSRREQAAQAASRGIVMADELMDLDAQTSDGEKAGDVEDLLIDPASGRVAFVVVATGGFLGLGERLHPLPFQTANLSRVDMNRGILALNIDRQQLREAPTFRSNDWRTIQSDPRAMREVYSYYGVQDQSQAFGYAPPGRDSSNRQGSQQQQQQGGAMDVDSVIRNWPQASQQAAREMIQRYGKPQGVTNDMIYWEDNGPWARTIVYRDPVQHNFPFPHADVLEQFVYMRVPPDKISDLSQLDGSLTVYRTEGLVSSRCNNEAMNCLALNLAYEVASGKRSAQEARQFLAQTAQQYQQGQTSPYTQQLMFQSQSPSQAAFPDNAGGAGQGGAPSNQSNDRQNRGD